MARTNRDYLRGLYGVIKDNDAHVRFTFLTGIMIHLIGVVFSRDTRNVTAFQVAAG